MIGLPFSQHDVDNDEDNDVRDPDGAGGGGGPGGKGVDDISSCRKKDNTLNRQFNW